MELPKRKNTRLQGYDYGSNGAYYVTICAHNRNEILSSICRGDPCGRPNIELTQLGLITQRTMDIISKSYNVVIDKYIIMPDHIHFIMIIAEQVRRPRGAPVRWVQSLELINQLWQMNG